VRGLGVDLISDVLPFGRLWYGEPNAVSNAVDYANFRSVTVKEQKRPWYGQYADNGFA
jgi:hypothetical protein